MNPDEIQEIRELARQGMSVRAISKKLGRDRKTIRGALGLVLSYLLVQKVMGRYLEENLGGYFPYFRIAGATAMAAIVLAVGLGAVAAVIPAYRAARLNVIDALRRVW